MRPALNARPYLILLVFILALVLTACERPLQEEPVLTPTTELPAFVTPGAPPGQLTPSAPLPGEPGYPGPGELPIVPAGETPVVTQLTYIVQPGDNLFTIAQLYNVPAETIAAANALAVDAVLEVGRTIIVPIGLPGAVAQPPVEPVVPTEAAPAEPIGERTHVVQAGENLYRIALQYGLTYQEIAAYNGLANPDVLDVGQVLLIPPPAP